MLPRYLLEDKAGMPAGHHLPKRPNYYDWRRPVSYPPHLPAVYQPPVLGDLRPPTVELPRPWRRAPLDTPGDFKNDEFRFWIKAKAGRYAVCRNCNCAFTEAKTRKEHLKAMGCAKTLVAAFKLLLRDKACVVCDERTSRTYYGVPLCGDKCVDVWRYDQRPLPALGSALLIVDRVEQERQKLNA